MCLVLPAAAYSGGTGTVGDPYRIGTRDDVIALGADSAHWDNHFIVTNDISLAAGSPTETIGNASTKFNGTFDGQGYTISDFVMDKSGSDYIGFFGHLGSGAEITNLRITAGDAGVSGQNYVGVLAGRNNGGTITDCSATGRVTASSEAGGLVGYNNHGTITSCSATGSAAATMWYAGGLVGLNYKGTITSCYATGNAAAGSGYAGGLVGVSDGGTITGCYATGNATAGSYAGGLVGASAGTITGCYASGSGTAGIGYAGGLVGVNTGTITNCYRHYTGGDCLDGTYVSDRTKFRDIAFLTGTTPGDGLNWSHDIISTDADPSKVWRVFPYKGRYPIFQWQSFGTGTITVNSVPAGADVSFNGVATGRMTNTTVSDLPEGEYNITAEHGGPAFSPAFSVVLLAADETKTVEFTLYSGGSGTPDDPYRISTRDDVISLGADSANWDKHFIVTNDISLAAGSPTETIGNKSSAEYYFTGTFDGQGYTISDFVMDKRYSYCVGFFGYLGSGAEIRNLQIATGDAGVIGDEHVGILAGYNDGGTITNCSATGSVTADVNAGGLVGYSDRGTITNCSATGSATADDYAGGLVGRNLYGTITSCSATGSATADDNYAGGLVGCFYYGTITNSSATGSATAWSYAGGLVGCGAGTITNCSATGSATARNNYAGGLLGYTDITSTITSCSATGSATATMWYAGGLVGRNRYGTITSCYAIGTVTAWEYAGGLVGYDYDGTITGSYATGSVTARNNYAGGLVGQDYGTITNCYATGNATGGNYTGGLVGYNDGGTITNCYRHYAGGDCLDGTHVPDRTKFGDIAFLTCDTPGDGLNWSHDIISTDADSAKVWRVFPYKSRYPIFQWQSFGTGTITVNSVPAGADVSFNGVATGRTTNTTVSDLPEGEYNITVERGDVIFSSAFSVVLLAADGTETVEFIRLYSGGSGTPDDPYRISTRGDVIYLSIDSVHWENHFIVTSDISLAAGSPTETIGNKSSAEYYFNGTFDGQGHTISDFVMDKGSSNYIGLFGCLGSGAEIRDLRIAAGDAGVTGAEYVGILAGHNDGGTITDCSATGSVTADVSAGVLAGSNYYHGTITSCSATGSVTAGNYAGGLVGRNMGTITSCSATGSATAGNYTGGLAGSSTGTITSCSATGNATAGSNYAGGLVGYSYDGTITSCSATGSATAGSNYAGGLAGNSLGTITNCYATGNATAGNCAGGLAGYSERTITRCYATGSAAAGNYAGGLVGRNWATITNCYATGSAAASSDAGGLVGDNGRTITNCYRHYTGGDCLDGTYVSDRTQFGDIAFLTGTTPGDGLNWSADSISTDADPSKVWRAFPYKGRYPIFQWQSFGTGTITVTSVPAGADVSLNGVATGRTTNTTVSDLPEGEYNVTVEKAGYQPAPVLTVQVNPNETAEAAFTLTPVGTAPVANFTANVTAGMRPLTVQFADTSTGEPTFWSWSFGDGETSSEQNPVHTYTAAGAYTVNLTVTNAAGTDATSVPGYITVERGTVSITAPGGGSATIGDAITLTGTNTDSTTTYLFLTGPGLPLAGANLMNLSMPVVSGSAATFTVAAVAVDDTWEHCWDTGAVWGGALQEGVYTVYAVSEPKSRTDLAGIPHATVAIRFAVPGQSNASFVADVTGGPAPLTVQFTDTSSISATSWSWTFGDGGTSTAQNPVHTYAAAGNYTVTLALSGGGETCTRSAYIKVTPVLFGDANGDGAVNQADTLRVLKEVVGLETKPASGTEQFQKTDVHRNGIIDVSDALFIAQYNVGLRDVWFVIA
ncbi:GLUG motif-containing protein [Methanoculleus frigidifontis]|nr:GLUG motif-containing protein [Methanoculleus sp. FWC-SCC1]